MIMLLVSLGTLDESGLYREVECAGYGRQLAQFSLRGRMFANASRVVFWRETGDPVGVTHIGFHEPNTGLALGVGEADLQSFDPKWAYIQFASGMLTLSIPAPKEVHEPHPEEKRR